MPFEELKAKQSVMWGIGPYERITDTLTDQQEALVERVGVQSGERWLDVATGTGAVARIAARRGANVTGMDLAPALVETARRHAEDDGLQIRFDVGDCEQLPYDDASFDAVVSNVGTMFAPDHEAVARELARVCRPGGRLGFTAWRPDGGVGEMFAVMRPYMPAPAAGVGNPFDWGREDHVRGLLGDAFELEFEERDSVLREPSGEHVWDLFVTSYGPTKTLAESLEEERREELRQAFVELHERERDGDALAYSRTYLLTTGRRR